ncbi:MAG: hypothetical protein ACR2LC_02720 [Pyrinomonadaceae bacterium]
MKKRAIIMSFTLTLVLGVAVYVVYHYSRLLLEPPATLPNPVYTTLQAPPAKQQGESSIPPPPSRPAGQPAYQPRSEPQRILIGTTNEQIRQIEQYLPEGAQIAIYPVSDTQERAAFATTDLAGNGSIETVAVYSLLGADAKSSDPLFLGVLAHQGNGLTLLSSTTLYGRQVYFSIYDKHAVPFALRDVTGDGRPEIIATSGEGASLGGALQVYSFDGSALHQLADVSGHTLDVYDRGVHRPSLITSRSRYDNETNTYEWNGEKFERTGKRAVK